jgi:NAD+ kinase
MFKSVHVVPKFNAENDPRVVMIANAVREVAKQRQLFDLSDSDKCTDRTLVVAIGGDGTMLGAMRVAARHNSVAMGINLGRIGFLTDFAGLDTPEAALKLMDDVLEYAGVIYPVESRLMIRAWHGHDSVVAGNEISIARDTSDSMITYRLIFDDTDAGVYRANSLLVSSPSGSTAYSLSAGGALMMPAVRAMQVVPVAALTMTARPIVISPDTQVEIQVWGGKITSRYDGVLWVDGNIEYTKDNPFTLFVQSHGRAKILHDKDWNYFNMLTQKLGWVKE